MKDIDKYITVAKSYNDYFEKCIALNLKKKKK